MKLAALLPPNEIWACEPDFLAGVISEIELYLALGAAGLGDLVNAGPDTYEGALSADGTLSVDIKGVILKSVPALFKRWGMNATGMKELQGTLLKAAGDSRVSKVLLNVDSGGGSTAGVQASAAMLRDFPKPVAAKVENAASAAYWLASQAKTLVAADSHALIGGIGVYTSIDDSSEQAKSEGVKVHLIRSGEFKGMGMPGTEVTPKHIAHLQQRVDTMHAAFIGDVNAGRGKDLTANADGKVYFANDAIKLGLADSLAVQQPGKGTDEVSKMGDKTGAQGAADDEVATLKASMAEMKAAMELQKAESLAKEKAAQAKAEAAEAKAALLAESQKQTAIEGAMKAGRLTPAMRPGAEKVAASSSLEELNTFLASMPVVVAPTASGSAPVQEGTGAALSAEDRKVMKMLGLTEAEFRQADNIASINLDGSANMKDGTTLAATKKGGN